MADEKEKRGLQLNQKMKPYLVYEYLMRYSDANHGGAVNEIRRRQYVLSP